MKITKNKLSKIVADSISKSEVCRKLGLCISGQTIRRVVELINKFNIDASHFNHKAAMNKFNRVYEKINKKCPICLKDFETLKNHDREKTVCSHSCSNVFFAETRRKTESLKSYRTICFRTYKKECIICSFDKVVEVHHIDNNRKNNSKENLIPLCPNHHQMLHTKKYRQEVLDLISEFFAKSVVFRT